MFGRANRGGIPPYPALQDPETTPAYQQELGWGSLAITGQALDAYALEVNRRYLPDLSDQSRTIWGDHGFRAGMLIVAPHESTMVPDGSIGATSSSVYPGGARITVLSADDKDTFGLNLTSAILDVQTMAMDPEEVPDFLREQGTEIHDQVKEEAPQVLAHNLTGLAASAAQTAFTEWVRIGDNKQAVRTLTQKNLTLFGSAACINAVDILSDGQSQPEVAYFTLACVALAVIKNRSALRNELDSQPYLQDQRAKVAARLEALVARDVHGLLCPGYAQR